LNETDFWKLSPRQTHRTLAARVRMLERGHNERAWLAWHMASLQRSKHLPALAKLQIKHPKPKRRQTWQEQLAIARQWVALGIGKIIGE
jgi:hypothetical protein